MRKCCYSFSLHLALKYGTHQDWKVNRLPRTIDHFRLLMSNIVLPNTKYLTKHILLLSTKYFYRTQNTFIKHEILLPNTKYVYRTRNTCTEHEILYQTRNTFIKHKILLPNKKYFTEYTILLPNVKYICNAGCHLKKKKKRKRNYINGLRKNFGQWVWQFIVD